MDEHSKIDIDGEPVTQLLQQARSGDKLAINKLFPFIYQELKKIARRSFKNENAGHTLQPTALINEAFENIVKVDIDWKDRNHFYALSARMMRRILVDHAKAKMTAKRGSNSYHTSINNKELSQPESSFELLSLDQSLEQLSKNDSRKAEIIELVYFGGLTHEEIAETLSISRATVSRDLRMAEAWLKTQLSD